MNIIQSNNKLVCNGKFPETHGRLARWRRWSAYDLREVKRRKGWRMSRAPCVASATSHLKWAENLPSLQLRHTSNEQSPFRCFSYVTRHSPILSTRRFSYVTGTYTYATWRTAHAAIIDFLYQNTQPTFQNNLWKVVNFASTVCL